MTITRQTARRAIDAKTKPLGALGRLEELAVRIAVLQDTLAPAIDPARICVFAADHGITAEGVSAYPSAVTAEMMKNFAAGGAAINVIARASHADVEVIDAGVDADLAALAGVRHAKVRRGTRNFAVTPAMTSDEIDAAFALGAAAVERAAADGIRAIGLGEMGIGNTTSAAALLSALSGRESRVTAGRGTGVDDATMERKRNVVDQAVRMHGLSGQRCGGRDALRCVGGYEIAAIAGAAIAAASRRMIVIADGFISTVAIACAAECARASGPGETAALRDAVFFAHRSAEAGHALALETCGAFLDVDVRPLLGLEMRLGEGSGAALALPLFRSAAAVMREMATFESARISPGEQADDHRGPAA
jgi:nicotinate-nucleotide--dimethylbenzimidazole phosphoribosyltransferase